MRYVFLLALVFASKLYADSEILYADSVSSPDQWANVGGANKVKSVSDDVDNNYIDETTQGEKQRFTLQNAGDIGQNDIIDSIVVHSRMRTPSGEGIVVRVNHIVSSTENGTDRELEATWTNYSDAYSVDPDDNDWSLTNINNLKIEADAVTIPVLNRAYCTKLYVVVYYTPASPNYGRRIYQQLMLAGD